MLLCKDLSIQELSYSVKNSLNLARRTNSNILRREIFYLHSVKKKSLWDISFVCQQILAALRIIVDIDLNYYDKTTSDALYLYKLYAWEDNTDLAQKDLEITSPTRICSELCVWSNGNLPCQGHGRERTGARFQLERFSLRGVTPGRISLRVLRGTHTGLYCL